MVRTVVTPEKYDDGEMKASLGQYLRAIYFFLENHFAGRKLRENDSRAANLIWDGEQKRSFTERYSIGSGLSVEPK